MFRRRNTLEVGNTTEVAATPAAEVQTAEADSPRTPYFEYGRSAGVSGEFTDQDGEVKLGSLAFDAAVAGLNNGEVPLPDFALAALREGYEEGAAAGRGE